LPMPGIPQIDREKWMSEAAALEGTAEYFYADLIRLRRYLRVLRQGVQGISELITEPGEINIDFADVKTVMKGRGDALMGIGIGEGTSRAVDAARSAINNPLLENARIDGAKSVLVNLAGGDGLTLQEYQDVVELITENCAEDALIIAGQAYNPELGEKIKVTVVATGFEQQQDTLDESAQIGEYKRRKMEGPSFEYKGKKTPETEQAQQDQEEEVITVNRWQDLQQQLGARKADNDYSFPAVLRYQRGEKEDS
ncbi:MAG: hypothetical protein PQJ35_02320, partial [Sphaerochaetaceae bacterium]|nr:hypothetical protein [Sphaerochaetaceae bacterium]